MSSLPKENLNMGEEQEYFNNRRTERAKWVLKYPEPPSTLKEITDTIKHSIFPRRSFERLSSSSSLKQSKSTLAFSFLKGLFPILSLANSYNLSKFKKDVMAGLTLASLSIPQSIGYANLAKLDPQYGLYTSVVPPLIYALMGSSREIAIGPVAVVSLLISSMIQDIEDPIANPNAYRKLVFTATFFAGTFQATFGLFRLGFLVEFLSHAAIVGFMAGAAIVIGLQQLKGLLGISRFTTKTDIVSVLTSVFRSIHDHSWLPMNFVLGCSFLIFILITRFIGRRNNKLFWIPAIAPLISVVLSTLIVHVTKADKRGIKIVRHFKGGINPSSVDQLQFSSPQLGQSAKIGLICAIIALTEAIAVGRSFASIKGYHIDGNKEMIAMGFMNIVGSLTSCYVATVAILASIILSALPGLIDINEALHIWKVDKFDFLACIGAFIGVLFVSVEIGLLIAVTISVAKIILNSIRPGTELLGRIPETDIFCDTKQYPVTIKTPGVLILRINAGFLCFANANFVRDRVMRWVIEEDGGDENKKGDIQMLVLDMSNVTNIDTSGIIALEELHTKLVARGIEFAIANPGWQVIHKLKLAKFVEKIGQGWIFLTVSEAVDACLGLRGHSYNDA